MPGTDGFDDVELRALAVEVDHDDRFGSLARDGRFEQRGVEIPRRGLGVDEDRGRALVDDGVGRGGEGEAGADDLVATPDAEQLEREVNGGGATRERRGVWHLHPGREFALEGVDVRAEGRDPVRVEGLEKQVTLVGAHVRR